MIVDPSAETAPSNRSWRAPTSIAAATPAAPWRPSRGGPPMAHRWRSARRERRRRRPDRRGGGPRRRGGEGGFAARADVKVTVRSVAQPRPDEPDLPENVEAGELDPRCAATC